MYLLKHGRRDDCYVRSVAIDGAGLHLSTGTEKQALQFVSRAAAIVVGKALPSTYGNFYVVEDGRY